MYPQVDPPARVFSQPRWQNGAGVRPMADAQQNRRWIQVEAERPSALNKLLARFGPWLDGTVGWPRLPLPLGIATLVGVRNRLRERNLFDTGVPAESGSPTAAQRSFRTADGRWNDLSHPSMGAAGTPFGRNVPPEANRPESEPALSTPNPRLVSRTLLTRDQFLPATTLNVLAAAWLQFEIHDWFSHANQAENPIRLKVQEGDPWPADEIVIERTQPADAPGKFVSQDTHWWDGSQIYGSSAEQRQLLRDGPFLKIDEGTIPVEMADHLDFSGAQAGFWAGWAMLHTLFALEHNAICEHLRRDEPRAWTDDDLYETARLVNVALMAKIHTTEWTPAIIAHPTTQRSIRINWWGISEKLRRSMGRISDNEVISGIPGSKADHHGAPYCLTEEFVAVYRMHPLIPDDFVFRSVDGSRAPQPRPFGDLRTDRAIPTVRELGMPDTLYSLGTAHPGAITLHNFPRALQEIRIGEHLVDLAAVDIVRSRERGVPRYNRFREAFHKPPVRSFDELTTNPAWAEEIRSVYDDDIDAVDLMVGLFAEPVPQGFGFSDTAFRVFILMASRRLTSDRFFTDHYDSEHYTRAGLRWIDDTSMKTLLLRHFPELAPSLGPIENAFTPWARIAHA